ncbi:Xaa-Pro aminopeptidase [Carboxydocella thermautotrophica]|nr:Xaa-Pro aminopeptidase [Carboxydocella thermautotrophica]
MNGVLDMMDRIQILQQNLQSNEIDGALIVSAIDVYYYSGTRQNALLWVPASGDPYLLVKKSFSRAFQESFLANVEPLKSLKELQKYIGQAKKIGLTLDVLPAQTYFYYQKLLPECIFQDISTLVREQRSIKSSAELEIMRKSASILCQVFKEVPDFLRPGVREIDLAAEFEYRARKAGHEGLIRLRAFNQELHSGHVLAGKNAAFPSFFDGPVGGKGLSAPYPQGPSRDVVQLNVPIVFDFVCVYEGYMVDMTRIFCLGDLDNKLKQAFNAALEIQNTLVQNLKPGAVSGQLFDQACSIAEKYGLQDNFMGYKEEQARFVGHGVGLELDELPVIALGVKNALLANQTIALEPKFIFPELGVVGIENTYLVTEQGGEKLTALDDVIFYL